MIGFSRLVARLAILAVLAAEVTLFALDVNVTVQGSPLYVMRGTTVADLARPWVSAARSGDLLDVEGRVIEQRAFRPRVLRNGRADTRRTVLRSGDDVRIVAGRNRTEPIKKESFEVFGSERSNPQFQLGFISGQLIVSKGAVSGKLASLVFAERHHGSSPNEVALTFDDGPHPRHTREVLEILRHYRVPATFFVVGERAAAYPELIEAEISAGMTIGDHTWDHPQRPSFSALPARKMKSEVDAARKILMDNGVTPLLFRPPGGAYSQETIGVARALGMRTVLWTIDPKDWKDDAKPARIAKYVLDRVQGGSIVLLHDGGGKREATVAALPKIIEGIGKKGLRLVAIRP